MSAHGGGRRKKAHEEEEHENHERWLVTYADMVTLLMVLFIVMFAMSVVDEKKYNALKAGMAAGFGQSTDILDGSSSILDQPGTAIAAPIAPNQVFEDLPEVDQVRVNAAVQEISRLDQQRRYAEATAEVNRFDDVLERINEQLRRRGLTGDVRAGIDERGLVLSLVSKHIVFEANYASLTPRGLEVVDTLAPVLRALEDPLQIDGHTNQVPVKPKFYETDWDLAAARAITVLRRFNERWGIPTERLRAGSFGAERPLIDPSLPRSQEVNKRVDVVVLSDLPSDVRELMNTVVRQRQVDRAAADGAGSTPSTDQTDQTDDIDQERAAAAAPEQGRD